MLFSLFLLGTFWFWALLAVECILLIVFVENERPGLATVSLVLLACLLYLFGDVNVVAYAVKHPLNVVYSLALYFLAGTVWAVAKWWFFVRRVRDVYNAQKARFIADALSWLDRVNLNIEEHWNPPLLRNIPEWLRGFLPAGETTKKQPSPGFLRQDRHVILIRIDLEAGNIPPSLRKAWKDYLGNTGYYDAFEHRFSNSLQPKASDHKGRIMIWMMYWPWSATWTLIDDPVRRAFTAIYDAIQGMLEGISKDVFKDAAADMEIPPDPPKAPPGGEVEVAVKGDGSPGDDNAAPWTPVRDRRHIE